MPRPVRKPDLVEFNLPIVRTLADMTPEERVAIAERYRAPLTHYDTLGRARRCNCQKHFASQPCAAPHDAGSICEDPFCPFYGVGQ